MRDITLWPAGFAGYLIGRVTTDLADRLVLKEVDAVMPWTEHPAQGGQRAAVLPGAQWAGVAAERGIKKWPRSAMRPGTSLGACA